MARTAIPGRLTWRPATVVETTFETPQVKNIALTVPGWTGHRAGQHVDVRLTAPDGYQAERCYSIASSPEDGYVVLSVERLDDGVVSPFLVHELRVDDEIELRGPVGGYFVWDEPLGGPLFLVADGSGLAPLRAMMRHHRATRSEVPVRALCSADSLEALLYRDELMELAACDPFDISITLTREQPSAWRGYHRRIDSDLLAEVAWPPEDRSLAYICGPTAFVETAAAGLVALGHDPARIRTERFGGPRQVLLRET
ncbi:ferredoxin reductase [Kribbella jiaozuonensis]|uniref:Oxidoreductase n=1 Tax=Kribbella jiaozuonensis TaxID=2575441 RepID=A0A4U3LZ01_9ACTN|nr:ferredoxin reductase [Kribbella jiaozuonensis]TKK80166.1 oxidoreductase [Kribbella jiaozuonensis]